MLEMLTLTHLTKLVRQKSLIVKLAMTLQFRNLKCRLPDVPFLLQTALPSWRILYLHGPVQTWHPRNFCCPFLTSNPPCLNNIGPSPSKEKNIFSSVFPMALMATQNIKQIISQIKHLLHQRWVLPFNRKSCYLSLSHPIRMRNKWMSTITLIVKSLFSVLCNTRL